MNIELKPKYLLDAGITLLVGGGIWNTIQGMRTPKVVDECKEKIAGIRYENRDGDEKETEKIVRKEKIKTGAKIAAMYAPGIISEIAGVKCVTSAYGIVKDYALKEATLAAGLLSTLTAYRGRVKERFGEETDRELYYGTKTEKIEVVEKNENGKERKVKKTVEIAEKEPLGYARYFCWGVTTAAEKNNDYNETFLRGIESSFNSQLPTKRFVYLNEVYEALGYAPSESGQHVGWVYDPENPKGDNCVDLRIRRVHRLNEAGAYEEAFMIDPNVDGEITQHLIDLGIMVM